MADAEPDTDDEGGETVVVDRAKATPAIDSTVVIDRRARRAPAAAEDDEVDRTVVVDRGTDDRTVVVDRPGRDSDKTIAVERPRRGKRADGAPKEPEPESVLRLLPTRRGIKTAPAGSGSGRAAVDAIGANAVETYVPREILPPPVLVPGVPRGADALRAEAPSMPSVTRRSRRAGVVAILVFAGACAVSVIGLVAVVVWFLRG